MAVGNPFSFCNAVYGNLKLMRKTLSAEQYAKYAALMNITLQNKGIELNK